LAREYFLKTPRLGFSRWTEKDLPLATTLWGDREVSRYLGGPFSPDQIQKRLAQEISWMAAHGLQYWPIFLLADGEFAGCCGLRPYKLDEKIYELGFHLLTAFWGRGLATEAAQASISFGFETLGASALFAGHHPENEISPRVLAKVGFRYTHDEIYPPTGELHPSYILDRPARAGIAGGS
jgi:[ribosomal protein S5]-alanine N-acetyltransferase